MTFLLLSFLCNLPSCQRRSSSLLLLLPRLPRPLPHHSGGERVQNSPSAALLPPTNTGASSARQRGMPHTRERRGICTRHTCTTDLHACEQMRQETSTERDRRRQSVRAADCSPWDEGGDSALKRRRCALRGKPGEKWIADILLFEVFQRMWTESRERYSRPPQRSIQRNLPRQAEPLVPSFFPLLLAAVVRDPAVQERKKKKTSPPARRIAMSSSLRERRKGKTQRET